jgi:hypothetical protein
MRAAIRGLGSRADRRISRWQRVRNWQHLAIACGDAMGSRHGCLTYAVRQCLRKTP